VSDDANAGQRDSYDTDALVLAARGDEICGQPFLASRIIVREKRGEQFRFTMLLGAADDDLFASPYYPKSRSVRPRALFCMANFVRPRSCINSFRATKLTSARE
jgi:hypothetical protein